MAGHRGSAPERLRNTIQDELERLVYLELSGMVAAGGTAAEDEAAKFSELACDAWADFSDTWAARVEKDAQGEFASWLERLEAGHQRLANLSNELVEAEKAFAWSFVLSQREDAYMDELERPPFTEPPDPPLDPRGGPGAALAFLGARRLGAHGQIKDKAAYHEDVAAAALVSAEIREAAETKQLQASLQAEQKEMVKRIREAKESRETMRARHAAQIEEIHQWLREADVLLDKGDFAPPRPSEESSDDEEKAPIMVPRPPPRSSSVAAPKTRRPGRVLPPPRPVPFPLQTGRRHERKLVDATRSAPSGSSSTRPRFTLGVATSSAGSPAVNPGARSSSAGRGLVPVLSPSKARRSGASGNESVPWPTLQDGSGARDGMRPRSPAAEILQPETSANNLMLGSTHDFHQDFVHGPGVNFWLEPPVASVDFS